jgi:hypothetical protein
LPLFRHADADDYHYYVFIAAIEPLLRLMPRLLFFAIMPRAIADIILQ